MSEPARTPGAPPAFKDNEGKLALWGSEKSTGPHVTGYFTDPSGEKSRVFGYFGVSQRDGTPYLRLLKYVANNPKGETIGYGNPNQFPGGENYEFKLTVNGAEVLIVANLGRGINEAQRRAIGCGEVPAPTPSQEQAPEPQRSSAP